VNVHKFRHAIFAFSLFLPGVALAQEKPVVVTTFTIIADMARNVAGDAAEVESITKPGAEIHNYQPTPRDILKARKADLVLRNGLNLELWFEKFLTNLSGVPDVTVSDGVKPMAISGGAYQGKPNPHAWMSPDTPLTPMSTPPMPRPIRTGSGPRCSRSAMNFRPFRKTSAGW